MKYSNSLLSGMIGGLVVVLALIAICVFFKPFNYKAIYIMNPQKVISRDSIINDSLSNSNNNIIFINDSLECLRISILKDLENKGLLLAPHEYTSHISSYYSTLVAFLIGLFVLFTVGSIYTIKITSKKEIDDAKEGLGDTEKRIRNDLKKDMHDTLTELLRDSISFKENIMSAIYGRIEDELYDRITNDLIEKTDKEKIEEQLKKIEDDISFLFESMGELPDKKTEKEELE